MLVAVRLFSTYIFSYLYISSIYTSDFCYPFNQYQPSIDFFSLSLSLISSFGMTRLDRLYRVWEFFISYFYFFSYFQTKTIFLSVFPDCLISTQKLMTVSRRARTTFLNRFFGLQTRCPNHNLTPTSQPVNVSI